VFLRPFSLSPCWERKRTEERARDRRTDQLRQLKAGRDPDPDRDRDRDRLRHETCFASLGLG
jgi:hypothetical protein